MPVPLAFDIETSPQPIDKLKAILPPWNPDSVGPHPGEFDPKSVKLGNLKDQAKIDEKIEEANKKHVAAIADYYKKKDGGAAAYWEAILQDAALSAVTGQVVAIGYQGNKTTTHLAIDGTSEHHLLTQFWKIYKQSRTERRSMVGFNIKQFDVPFIAQRSWMLGIEVPATLITPPGRYLDSLFVDLDEIWKCGNRGWAKPGHGSLDTICKALGLVGKPDDCSGAEFSKLLYGTPEQRAAAVRYLEGDLRMTAELAERLGIA